MYTGSDPFDWEPDSTSKTNFISTSQDFNRNGYSDQSQVVPGDWASVVQPFQQRRSIDSNGDIPFFADKWLSTAATNNEPRNQRTSIVDSAYHSLKDSERFLWRAPLSPSQSSHKSDNIFRAVIKLSLIVNQRLKLGVYKMRTGSSSKVKPKVMLGLLDDPNFREGYRSSGFTFGSKGAFSLTPSQVNFKKQQSIFAQRAQPLKRKLTAMIMRQAFGKLKTFRRGVARQPINTDSQDIVKLESIVSLSRKKPVPNLSIQHLTAENANFRGEEKLIVPGRLERHSKVVLPAVEIAPDTKNMQENGQETDHSAILPQPLGEQSQFPKARTAQTDRIQPSTIYEINQARPDEQRRNRLLTRQSVAVRPVSENPYVIGRPVSRPFEYRQTIQRATHQPFHMVPQVPYLTDRPFSPQPSMALTSRQTFTLDQVLERINRSNGKQIRPSFDYFRQSPPPKAPVPMGHYEHTPNKFMMVSGIQQPRSPLSIPIAYAHAISPRAAVSPRSISPGGQRFMQPPPFARPPPVCHPMGQYGLTYDYQSSNVKPFQKPAPMRYRY